MKQISDKSRYDRRKTPLTGISSINHPPLHRSHDPVPDMKKAPLDKVASYQFQFSDQDAISPRK